MILLVAAWMILGGLAFLLGAGLLSRIERLGSYRPGDYFFISVWLGLAGLEWIAVCISFFSPVKPALFVGVAALAAALLIGRGSRTLAATMKPMIGQKVICVAVVVLLACGFIASGLRWTPDAGEYHYPAVRWLAEFGTVLGFGNVLIRFGFTSGTWALLAPFEVLMPGRSAAVLNGFILCLLNGHIVLFLYRNRTHIADAGDWFLGACSAGLVAVGTVAGFFTTNAPDALVAALTIVVGWQLFMGAETRGAPGSLLPLLLAGGAMNAKLSALMLLPVAALFSVLGSNLRRWIVVSLVGVVLVLPYFIASMMASGCLAMPATQSCFPVPWAVPLWRVAEIADQLWVWARWQSPLPADATPFGWLSRWFFASNGFWFHAAVFWPATVCFVAWLAVAKLRFTRGESWVVGFIVPSLVVLFTTAPDVRYNLGLFMVPLGLLAMRLAPATKSFLERPFVNHPLWAVGTLIAIELVVALAIEHRRFPLSDAASRVLYPRAVPKDDVAIHPSNGFQYYRPVDFANGRCWTAPIPCTDREMTDVTLLDSAKGIAGGFRYIGREPSR